MEYTDQYVYLNLDETVAATAPVRNAFKLVLNNAPDRVTYALVEVMCLSVRTGTNTNNHFTLKAEEIGQNYLGQDNIGTALAVAHTTQA